MTLDEYKTKYPNDWPWKVFDRAQAFVRKYEKRGHRDLARVKELIASMTEHSGDGMEVKQAAFATEILSVLDSPEEVVPQEQDKASSAPCSASDAELTYSVVPSVTATHTIERRTNTWPELIAKLSNPREYPRKDAMPLITFATFGDKPNAKGSLRHNGNVINLYGLVGDYDAGLITLAEAAARLNTTGIEAVLYSTPSHTPDNPRWRVVAPFSEKQLPSRHAHFMDLLNGALGGILSPESWTLSQTFYVGQVKGKAYECLHVPGGRIDLLELVGGITPIGKPAASSQAAPAGTGDDLLDVVRANEHTEVLAKVDAKTLNDLRAALAVIPSDDRDLWQRMGHALASLKGTEHENTARELFNEWSRKSPKCDDAGLAKWDTFNAERTDYRAVFAEAKRHGWTNTGKAKNIFDTPPFTPKGYTAEQLANMDIQPVKYIVDDLLLEGVFILAASPKVGKSWLTLQMAHAIASGTEILGRRVPISGDVLLLALEDNARRMKNRFEKLGLSLMSEDQRSRIEIHHEWPRVGDGGAEHIEAWLQAHPGALFVVVDVLEQLRPARSTKANPYSEDYESLVALKRLATQYRVAIIVVHHTRKADSYDPLQLVSGTQGLTGAADGIIVLDRPRGDNSGTLHVMARDLEHDGAFAVAFNDGQWSMVGPAGLVAAGSAQQAVLDALRDAPEGLKLREIATEVGKNSDAVNHVLRKLIQQGRVVKQTYGKYDLAPTLREAGLAVTEDNDGLGLV